MVIRSISKPSKAVILPKGTKVTTTYYEGSPTIRISQSAVIKEDLKSLGLKEIGQDQYRPLEEVCLSCD